MRESFVFYRSFFEALLGMDNSNQGDCLMALANYALNGKEPEVLTPEVRMFFTLVKPQIDANNQRFENGCKGGRPKTETKPNENQKETKTKPNVNDNVNVNVNVNDIKEKSNNINIITKKEKFKKPTIEEINAYCRERNNSISGEQFFNFYESKGWRVGNQAMKDWKAAVRTWEAKEKTLNAAKNLIPSHSLDWL